MTDDRDMSKYYDDTYDNPAYLAWCEEQEAIHTGSAIELINCYLCYLEATGKPDTSPKQNQGPLRGILDHSIIDAADPTDALHLSCGHVII